jgi:hypothetical protein
MREGLDGARIYAASGGGKKCLLTSPFIGQSYPLLITPAGVYVPSTISARIMLAPSGGDERGPSILYREYTGAVDRRFRSTARKAVAWIVIRLNTTFFLGRMRSRDDRSCQMW